MPLGPHLRGAVSTEDAMLNAVPRQGSGLEGRTVTERVTGAPGSCRWPQASSSDWPGRRGGPGPLPRLSPAHGVASTGPSSAWDQTRASLGATRASPNPQALSRGQWGWDCFLGARGILEEGVSLRLVVKKEENTWPGLRASERPGHPRGSPVLPPIPIALPSVPGHAASQWAARGHSTQVLLKCRKLAAAQAPSPRLPVGALWPAGSIQTDAAQRGREGKLELPSHPLPSAPGLTPTRARPCPGPPTRSWLPSKCFHCCSYSGRVFPDAARFRVRFFFFQAFTDGCPPPSGPAAPDGGRCLPDVRPPCTACLASPVVSSFSARSLSLSKINK